MASAAAENDDFANAATVGDLPATFSWDPKETTQEAGETTPCWKRQAGHDVPSKGPIDGSGWFRYEPRHATVLRIDSAGSDDDTVIGVYLGSHPAMLELVACNDDAPNPLHRPTDPVTSRLEVEVFPGNAYAIQVISKGTPGHSLRVKFEEVTVPPNDDWSKAIDLVAAATTVRVDTTLATIDRFEPAPCGAVQGTVWYRIAPLEPVALRLASLDGTEFDASLAVFDAPLGGGLRNVACDNSVVVSPRARIHVSLNPGHVYLVQAGGSAGAKVSLGPRLLSDDPAGTGGSPLSPVVQTETQGGWMIIEVSPLDPPANDDRHDALDVSTLPLAIDVDTSMATAEESEPQPWVLVHDDGQRLGYPCQSPTPMGIVDTVWYRLAPAEDVSLEVHIDDWAPANFLAGLALYEEGDHGNLQLVDCVSAATTANQADPFLAARLRTGTVYLVQAGNQANFGVIPGVLSLRFEAISGPANDGFASATPVTSLPFAARATSLGATRETGEPFATYCAAAADVFVHRASTWFDLVVPISQSVQVTATVGPGDWLLDLVAYSGEDLGGLVVEGCGVRQGSKTTAMTFGATAGVTYHIQVASPTGYRARTVDVEMATLPGQPGNDFFARAVAVNAPAFHADVDVTAASRERGEPVPCNFVPYTVWYRLEPSTDSLIHVDALSSAAGVLVAVYEGNDLASLKQLACADDVDDSLPYPGMNSVAPWLTPGRLSFAARTATTYHVMVGPVGFHGGPAAWGGASIRVDILQVPQ